MRQKKKIHQVSSMLLTFTLTFCSMTSRIPVYAGNDAQHMHTENCYCKGGEYICGLTESRGHTHDPSCYEYLFDEEASSSNIVRRTLICDEKPSQGHTHTKGCICPGGKLVCDIELPDETIPEDSVTDRDLISDEIEPFVEVASGSNLVPFTVSQKNISVRTDMELIRALNEEESEITLTLEDDINIDLSEEGALVIDCAVTLDCNGFTLSAGNASYLSNNDNGGLFQIKEDGTLTFINADIQMEESSFGRGKHLENVIGSNDGTVVVESTSDNGITCGNFVSSNDGNTSIENGVFDAKKSIIGSSSGDIEVHSGDFTSDGTCFDRINGTMSINNAQVRSLTDNCIYVLGNGTVDVYKGNYIARDDCINNQGTVTIHQGASFEATNDSDGCLYPLNGNWNVADDAIAIPENWKETKASKVQFASSVVKIRFYSEGKLISELEETPSNRRFPEPPVNSEGYEFCGWEDENGNAVTDLSIFTADTDLYAVFSDRTYTVTFDDNGVIHSETVAINTPLGTISGLERKEAGDSFCFWMLGDDIVDETSTMPVVSDLTLKAVYGDAVSNYDELIIALNNKKTGIRLIGNIEVSSTISVDYSCLIDGNGFHFIRPDGFTESLLHIENDSSVEEKTCFTLTNTVVDGREIEANESAIVAEEDTSLLMVNVTVENNHTSSSGGGIRLSGTDATLTNCVLQNNITTESGYQSGGGGIFADTDWTTSNTYNLTLNGCIIQNNKTAASGGGIYQDNYQITLTNCVIDENQADSDGGGLTYSGDDIDAVQIIDTIIKNNKAGEDGGGIALNRPIIHLYGNTCIMHNEAGEDGGGVESSSGEKNTCILYMHDSSAIRYNTSHIGGGVSCDELFLVMYDNSSIDHNHADENGGGIYAASYGMRQEGGVIRDNDTDGSGGGVYVTHECLFTDGMMFDNRAEKAGDDLFNDRDLQTLYPTQSSRYFKDGDSESLKTVMIQTLADYYPVPEHTVAVPWYGWFVDGKDAGYWDYGQRKYIENYQDLYSDFETGILVSKENDNFGILKGDIDDIGVKAIWYGLVLAYDANYEGSSDYMYDPNGYLPDSNASVLDNVFRRPGYKFNGWNTEKDGSGDAYGKGELLLMDKSQVLYAQWIEDDTPTPPDPEPEPKPEPDNGGGEHGGGDDNGGGSNGGSHNGGSGHSRRENSHSSTDTTSAPDDTPNQPVSTEPVNEPIPLEKVEISAVPEKNMENLDTIPKTGDEFHLKFWLSLMGISLAGLFALMIFKKKDK